jgi:hypothetical protein
LGIVHIQNGDVLVLIAARHDAASADDQARIVHPRQRHREAGAVLVAIVQPDEGIVTMGADHALGRVGDQVAGRQAGVASFVSLRDVVAHAGGAKGTPDQPRIPATLGNLLPQLVGVHVAQIAFQQGHADPDLRAVELFIGQSQAVIKCGHAPLPAVGQLLAIPIQGMAHGCFLSEIQAVNSIPA